MAVTSKPAHRVAIASMALGVVFFVITLILGKWSGFYAVSALSWYFLGSALIWLVLFFQFYQRTLAEQEKLEMGQLEREKATGTIFQARGERERLFAVAQKRLDIFEKWFLPIFSILIATYQIGIGTFLIFALDNADPTLGRQPLLCAVISVSVFFVSFLVSKYATGMSSQAHWKPLRAGGSFLFASAILALALAIALALSQFQNLLMLRIVGYVFPVLLMALGIETLLNVILDIYRPRLTGQYSRSAFDSRLLGILNEPGEILHTAAGAIDYQFGFKVSQTWFYKLLEKAVFPLALFALVTLYLLSCLVVVESSQQAVIEHFGNPKDAAGNVRLVEPGLHLKFPWPFGVARKYPVDAVRDLYIGYKPKFDPKTGKILPEPLLWGKDHYEQEYNVLVAGAQAGTDFDEGAAPVGILKANIPVQYSVKDLYAFHYGHDSYTEDDGTVRPGAEKRLEEICYRELTRYCAASTIEVDDEEAIRRSLLGAGRTEAKQALTDRIQKAADEAGLGVKIVFLGLQGIHPPTEVAADYQAVVGAVQKKQAAILQAHLERNRILSTLAGSVEKADSLYNLAAEYQQAQEQGDTEKADQIAIKLDEAFASAQGEIFTLLSEAQGYAFDKAVIAKATGERFDSQLRAYRAGGQIYVRELILNTLSDSLAKVRKYIAINDPSEKQTFIFDVKEKPITSLYEISGFEETSEQ